MSTVKADYSFCFQMDNSDAVVDLAARMALLARQVCKLYFTLLFTPWYLRIFLNQDTGDITMKLQGGDQVRKVHSHIIFARYLRSRFAYYLFQTHPFAAPSSLKPP